MAAELRTDTVVVRIYCNPLRDHRCGIKNKPIVLNGYNADSGNDRTDRIKIVVQPPQQVDVARRPSQRPPPMQTTAMRP